MLILPFLRARILTPIPPPPLGQKGMAKSSEDTKARVWPTTGFHQIRDKFPAEILCARRRTTRLEVTGRKGAKLSLALAGKKGGETKPGVPHEVPRETIAYVPRPRNGNGRNQDGVGTERGFPFPPQNDGARSVPLKTRRDRKIRPIRSFIPGDFSP